MRPETEQSPRRPPRAVDTRWRTTGHRVLPLRCRPTKSSGSLKRRRAAPRRDGVGGEGSGPHNIRNARLPTEYRPARLALARGQRSPNVRSLLPHRRSRASTPKDPARAMALRTDTAG